MDLESVCLKMEDFSQERRKRKKAVEGGEERRVVLEAKGVLHLL